MIAPGGMGGAVTLRDDNDVQQLVASFYEKKKIVAFICAGKIPHFNSHTDTFIVYLNQLLIRV